MELILNQCCVSSTLPDPLLAAQELLFEPKISAAVEYLLVCLRACVCRRAFNLVMWNSLQLSGIARLVLGHTGPRSAQDVCLKIESTVGKKSTFIFFHLSFLCGAWLGKVARRMQLLLSLVGREAEIVDDHVTRSAGKIPKSCGCNGLAAPGFNISNPSAVRCLCVSAHIVQMLTSLSHVPMHWAEQFFIEPSTLCSVGIRSSACALLQL